MCVDWQDCVLIFKVWCWYLEACFQDAMNKISQVFAWAMYGSDNVDSVIGKFSSCTNFGYSMWFRLDIQHLADF